MCCVGDIILVDKDKHNGKQINKHSFVVVDDDGGEIQGYSYDLICNVLSSFKNEDHKKHKLSYPGNFPISHDDTETNPHNDKDGYVKAEQLYYFDKNKISYKVIGQMNQDVFNEFMEFFNLLDVDILEIIDNLE